VSRFRGAYVALVTPFTSDRAVDAERFGQLLDFQARSGIRGVVVGGTTAESPTLSEFELLDLLERTRERLPEKMEVIAGAGRNDLATSRRLISAVGELGIRAIMVVDPAYNAPSSLEIRREYLDPIAGEFPQMEFLSYVVPARTGTRLGPVDLALAHQGRPNIVGVKDACGDPEYSREVRRLLPSPFTLLAGDDGRAPEMIADPRIRADGLVSVVGNVAPQLVAQVVDAALEGDRERLARLVPTFQALSQLVSFQVEEHSSLGPVAVKVRNPVPVKAAFSVLGAGVGPCRPPLGRLGPAGFGHLVNALEGIDRQDSQVFAPLREGLGDGRQVEQSREDARASWSYLGY
jgi:4-hydroxy-tetrahydrodipicolinate synthase